MAAVQFYPVDAAYKVVHDRPAVYLFGRTPAGEQVCVMDSSLEPYFYVVPEPGADPVKELLGLKAGQRGEVYSVTRVVPVQRKCLEEDSRVLQVFTNVPKAVAELKGAVQALPGVKSVCEADIPFVRRYFIDKGLTPMTLVSAEGEQAAEDLRVPAIRAAKVSQVSDATLSPRLLAIDIETYNPSGRNVQPDQHQILMIALAGDNFRRVLTWKKIPDAGPFVEFLPGEADVLARLVELVKEYGPDMIAGYYSDGFDFPFIRTRASKNRVRLDFGLDNSELRIEGRSRTTARITGIAHIDVHRVITKLFAKTMKTDVFTLDAVAKELLGRGKHSVDIEKLAGAWDANDSVLLKGFAEYNLQDAQLTYELAQLTMPNLTEFVKIVGQLPFDINRMGFSQLVEWYVLRQAFLQGELAPNRPGYGGQQARARDRIKGAFVFEPTPGLYPDIAVCDYRSLYPSIIASHNISPGMRNCACCETARRIQTQRGTFWYCQKRKGFLSSIIEDLIVRRARIKDILRQGNRDRLLLARSQALKDLANSFYGYLAFSAARWYDLGCAESTTAWARHYIASVIEQAQKDGFVVLYADTDSSFLRLGSRTIDDARQFVESVNSSLPKPMELELEGHYPAGLFVSVKAGEAGAKKKYALLDQKGRLKIVGFETVRRNWSPIAKDVQKQVLEILLRERRPENALALLRKIVDDIGHNRLPVESVTIHTALSKDISEYESTGPHVAAAKRMQEKGQQVGPGTIIHFVVVRGKGRVSDRVRLPDEISRQDYDSDYYISNQILPGVERIFSVFGINTADIFAEKSQSTLGKFIRQ